MIKLLVGYDAAIAELVRELEACGAPDSITIRSYLIEPGVSTDRVLAALEGALGRGSRVEIVADGTIASWWAHFWERTEDRFGAFAKLAAAFPDRASARRIRTVDHSKYAIFERTSAPSSALIGGINLGDRFAPWRDFAVRVEGEAIVGALIRSLAGEDVAAIDGVKFVAALPGFRSTVMKEAFERIADDATLTAVRIAMAYVDEMGASIIERALRRGARVELTIPAQANVYQHSNQRTVARLLRKGGALTLHACRSMVHAKALVALDASGPRQALLGSANLKRNSLIRFGELDASIDDVVFARALSTAFDALLAESDPLTKPRWRTIAAAVEERFG